MGNRGSGEDRGLFRDIPGPFPERVPLNLEMLGVMDCGACERSLIAWETADTAAEFKLLFHEAGHGLTP